MKQIAGDFAIKNLTPHTTNLGDRLVKNMRVCGSGIYTYHKSEMPVFHLSPIPKQYENLEYINIYRPPEVLIENKDKFARVPIITGHHVLVDRDNAKQLSVGMVGDNVEYEKDDSDGETYLYTTGTIVAGDGVDAYEKYGQLSVGYDPDISWCDKPGTHNGVEYQAVLRGFNDVNHLLICKTARGGPQCMIMDSSDRRTELQRLLIKYNGGNRMSVFDKIFGRKKLAGDCASIVTLLHTLTLGADKEKVVTEIKALAGDSADAQFNEYLDALAKAKDETPEDVSKVVDMATKHWMKLSGDEEEKACPQCGKSPCVCDDKKEATGDEDKEAEEAKDEKPEEEKKAAGDEGIDYDRIINGVVTKLQESRKDTPVSGDEKVDEKTASEELSNMGVPMAGDATKAKGSDDFLKDIF